ncbi:DUF6745 domain-containing protein [Dapis sp. BLCC M126]|uniref:DUF6745 domain-containing protein n=1 Tax=Dapis sp. BLCC M126 TaxID=3400189 RepID=UPI003CF42C11
MSQKLITKLTPKQKALIPVYREKWQKIALSTQPINRQKAAEAIQRAYALMSDPNPEIVFSDSPRAAFDILLQKIWQRWKSQDNYGHRHIFKDRWELLRRELEMQVTHQLCTDIDSLIGEGSLQPGQLWSHILYSQIEEEWQEIISEVSIKLLCLWSYPIPTELWSSYVAWVDFCISVLNCNYNSGDWQVLESIVKHCGWIYPLRNLCIICDRPRKLLLDDEYRPHAVEKPAIEFIDGYSLYAYHGVRLPEAYGKFNPQEWESEWLLTTENAELRRVLIQEIGYEKICQDLETIEIDNWQEYILLRIDDDADIEPIFILKMICPSTGNIHTLRVPPNVNSAKEAVEWINWGINPEEFSVQT